MEKQINKIFDTREDFEAVEAFEATEVFGALLVAIGTITAAIGSTPLQFIKSSLRQDFSLVGNVLQSVGGAVQANAFEEFEDGSLETIGNAIQSFGNISVISGLIINFKDETQQKLIINGNWLQALGGVASFGEEIEKASSSNNPESSSNWLVQAMGNILQAIGNSLQAIDGIQVLKESQVENNKDSKENEEDTNRVENEENEDKWSLDTTGSWIQATGSIISLIGQIKQAEEVEEQEAKEQKEQINTDKQTEKLTNQNDWHYSSFRLVFNN
ncbi:hypothetical protein [Bacillus sp. 165]|uniref:DUF6944 family repetitive protein n=1 Tax=Bacillus sp. 165 TaxID=1529117 RepID=UPI001FFE1C29|nr:hypothetical protein [Bacillus sp. 165]